MDPVGELPTTQTETVRVVHALQQAVAQASDDGPPTTVAELLDDLLAALGKAVSAVSSGNYTTADERLYLALHAVHTSLAAVPEALTGNQAFQDAAAGLAALRARALDEFQRPPKPLFGGSSVGFEWQTDIKVDMKKAPPSKTLLKRWPDNGEPEVLRLELDGDELEFVTAPVTTTAALERQFTLIQDEIDTLRQKGAAGYDYALPEDALSDEDGTVAYPKGYKVHVRHYGGQPRGALQATIARTLDQLKGLLTDYGGVRAARAIEIIDTSYDEPPSARVAGLLYLVRYYVQCLAGGTTEDQGPKVLLPVMSRTDFHSAYLLLTPEERDEFKECVFYRKGTTGDYEWRGTTIAHPKTYPGPAGAEYSGPTIGAWYDSIVDGSPSTLEVEPLDRDNDGSGPRGTYRDLLSPPEGYPAHRRGRHFTYAMGYFGTADDGSLLFELRQVEKVPANVEPAFKKFSSSTVYDAMWKFGLRELGATTTTTTGGATDRPAKRRRIEKGKDQG